MKQQLKEQKGKMMCNEDDCYGQLDVELDVEFSALDGHAYEPSLKCHKCRTAQDRKKIKRYRKIQNGRLKSLDTEPTPPYYKENNGNIQLES